MDKTLRNAIIAGIFIVSLSFGYYFVIFLPQKTKKSEVLLDNCLYTASNIKSIDWNNGCASEKLNDKCSLPVFKADNINKAYENNKDDCFRQYPQK